MKQFNRDVAAHYTRPALAEALIARLAEHGIAEADVTALFSELLPTTASVAVLTMPPT